MSQHPLRRATTAAVAFAVALLASAPLAGAVAPAAPHAPAAPTARSFGGLPMRFERNVGQTDARAKFLARTSSYSLFLTDDEAVFSLRGAAPAGVEKSAAGTPRPSAAAPTAVLRMKPVGADPSARVTGEDVLPGTSSYFLGDDPSAWRTKVPAYAKVRYEGVYRGVDLVYYGGESGLEFDFAVAPGADASVIRLAFDGAESVSVDGGELVVRTAAGEVRQKAPVAYQPGAGGKRAVTCRYATGTDGTVGFELGDYDRSAPLVIDPVILFSTLLGGTGGEIVNRIAVDADGFIYVTGGTSSPEFPITDDSHGPRSIGFSVSFVAKLTPDGSSLVYSATLGGSNYDSVSGLAVGADGSVYVDGSAGSPDFPTVNPIQTDPDGVTPDGTSDRMYDGFLTKLSADASALVYSTYVCGSGADTLTDVALGPDGSAYVVGYTASRDLPVVNAAQSTHGEDYGDAQPIAFAYDVLAARVDPAGSSYEYLTYLGGEGDEDAYGVDVDGDGNAYVVGQSSSPDYPTRNSIKELDRTDSYDGVLTKLGPSGAIVYSTYFGGSDRDGINDVAVDAAGAAYVVGTTDSRDLPVRNSLRPFAAVYQMPFAAKIAPSGTSIDYCTFLTSGSQNGTAVGVSLQPDGSATIAGWNQTQITNESYRINVAIWRLTPDASAFVFDEEIPGDGESTATCVAVDAAGAAYVGGATASSDFPTTLTPPFDPNQDYLQAFVLKLGDPTFDTVAKSDKNGDVFLAVAKDPTDRNYGYWEYRVASTGQVMHGRASSVLFDAGAGLTMQDAKARLKLKASFDYAADKAVVSVANARTGAKRKLVDTENSLTPMP